MSYSIELTEEAISYVADLQSVTIPVIQKNLTLVSYIAEIPSE